MINHFGNRNMTWEDNVIKTGLIHLSFLLWLALSLNCVFANDAKQMFNGVQVGFTEEGYPFIGEANAPVTMWEYSDYLCPFCGRHARDTYPKLLEQYISTGKLKLVFRDFAIPSLHSTAHFGHEAAWCVSEQNITYYWQMHDLLFERQSQWATISDPSGFLEGLVKEIGAKLGPYRRCFKKSTYQQVVEQGFNEAREMGFNGTPSFRLTTKDDLSYDIVGAQPLENFQIAIESLTKGELPPEPEEPPPPELPYWANEEGLKPNPDKPGFTMAGDAFMGDPNAPLVIVEFSDFQCPFCAQHALEVQPMLNTEFIETGKVMWVFKHFPLAIHPQAPAAAAAAECAAEQGHFWAMHDMLFESQELWSVEEVDDAILRLAVQVEDLNVADFASCFGARASLQKVLSDIFDGQGLISSTPTFITLINGRGRVQQGFRELDDFRKDIESYLEELNEDLDD